MKRTMSGLALATLVAIAPAGAEPSIRTSHEVRFEQITFTCGELDELGKTRRFVYATPYKINLPMYEPLPQDPDMAGWLVAYRTICERVALRSQFTNARKGL